MRRPQSKPAPEIPRVHPVPRKLQAEGLSPPLRALLALALIVCGLMASDRAWSASPTSPPAVFEPQVLMVRVNGVDAEEMLVALRDESGGYWLEAGDFQRLRLQLPGTRPHVQEGRSYFPLKAIEGISLDVDGARAQLNLSLPAAAFQGQQLHAESPEVVYPLAASTGLFLNYDVYADHARDAYNGSALVEMGLFSNYGVLMNSSVFRNYEGSGRHVRLDTAISRDFPSRLETLTLGDNFSDPASWGSALRFGGIRYARNFGIRPDLVTTPMLGVDGSAVVPSTVDVFVNNQQVMSQDVQAGPFTIDNLPPLTGAGNVNLVVRDAQGREVVLSQAFYSSALLLGAGLTQFSVAAGAIRENYALTSNDYGPTLASASIRRGLTNELTIEGHAEYLDGHAHAGGMQLAGLLGNVGIGTVTLAAGGDDDATGWMGGLGFERHGSRGSVGFAVYRASDGFRRAADPRLEQFRMRLRGIAQASWRFGALGTSMLAYARNEYQDGAGNQTFTLNHSAQLRYGSLNLSVSRTTGVSSVTQGFLTFSMMVGSRRSMEASAETLRGDTEDSSQLRASVTETAPVGAGHGWRVAASSDGDYNAWWLQRFDAAEVELQAASYAGTAGQSVTVRGGATLLGGMLRASRRIDSSFAVVDVGGIPGIPVFLENQLVAHTDDRGRALLPSLLAYDINRISIEPLDLPLNTEIDSRQMEIRPAYRSGVLARFPVERTAPGTFTLVREDGSPVPAGATVQLNGGTFNVALDGYTYVTTLAPASSGIVEWAGGRCTFKIDAPSEDDPLPDLGRILCTRLLDARR